MTLAPALSPPRRAGPPPPERSSSASPRSCSPPSALRPRWVALGTLRHWWPWRSKSRPESGVLARQMVIRCRDLHRLEGLLMPEGTKAKSKRTNSEPPGITGRSTSAIFSHPGSLFQTRNRTTRCVTGGYPRLISTPPRMHSSKINLLAAPTFHTGTHHLWIEILVEEDRSEDPRTGRTDQSEFGATALRAGKAVHSLNADPPYSSLAVLEVE